jgi:hypothetical protein
VKKSELTAAVQAKLAADDAALDKLDDGSALKVRSLHQAWAVGVAYKTGNRRRYGDHLYKARQAHTSQADWTPDVAVSLWEMIPEPGQGDTPDNPIPYSGNMALEKDKYYTQDGVTYRCFRDTINPVVAALKDLVGLYVEVVEG